MNTKLALTAIAMFAVIMGVSAVVPSALAAGSNGQKTTLCHFQAEELDADGNVIEEAHVSIINVNNRALTTHQAHGDLIIPDEISEADCPVTPDPDDG